MHDGKCFSISKYPLDDGVVTRAEETAMIGIGEGSSCTGDGYEGRAVSERSGVVAGLDGMTVGSVGEDGRKRQPSSCE